MGREVKRVALDFSWPLKKVWDGFLNPHYRQCAACEGSGSTTAYKRLEELVRLIVLSADDTQRKRGVVPHPYFSEMSALYHTKNVVVSPDIVPLVEGLCDEKVDGSPFGLGGGASYRAMKKIVAAAGLNESWGQCSACHGEGIDPAFREAYESWKETPPPSGDGWQMWEDTSEGSPISPVFDTPEKLARWLADNKASTFGSDTASYDTWLRMIVGDGWAPSAVIQNGVMMSGVDAASIRQQSK